LLFKANPETKFIFTYKNNVLVDCIEANMPKFSNSRQLKYVKIGKS